MGGAMLTGWLDRGLSASVVHVQEPNPAAEIEVLLARHAITRSAKTTQADIGGPAGLLLMSVKPQVMAKVFDQVSGLIGPDTLVLSVAAGRTIASFEAAAPKGTAVVRAIPNTPAAIGRGITVCCANSATRDAQRAACDLLLAAIGEVGWVDDEALIDAATAVSGSGPAYVFLLAECLAAAGQSVGLDAALSRRLADATVAGAGELMRVTGEDPAQLRRNVTSPNGTTQAALDVLMATPGLGEMLTEAVQAANRRSRELSE